MTKAQAQIIELFKTLDPAEQRELASQLYELTLVGSFYDRMTPQQRVGLDEGIVQAEHGQARPADEVFKASRGASAFRRNESRLFRTRRSRTRTPFLLRCHKIWACVAERTFARVRSFLLPTLAAYPYIGVYRLAASSGLVRFASQVKEERMDAMERRVFLKGAGMGMLAFTVGGRG